MGARSYGREFIVSGQRATLAFFFIVFLAFLQAGFWAANYRQAVFAEEQSAVGTPGRSSYLPQFLTGEPGVIYDHPIPKLMQEAETQYRAKLERQSKTLNAAVAEYRRRYKRAPPKGFDKWFEFAQKHNVVMVDEYDSLMNDLAPFRGLSGEEFRRRVQQVSALPAIDLVQVRNGQASAIHNAGDNEGASGRATGLVSMMHEFIEDLPDVDLPVNAKSESRVLVPWEQKHYKNLTVEDSSGGITSVMGGPYHTYWGDDGNVWEAWRRTCDPASNARRLFSTLQNSLTAQTYNFFGGLYKRPSKDFKFASATSFSIDYCSRPEMHYGQGHFFSDWRTIPALYPVLSPAKARGFLDIKVPSHYYYGSTPRYTYGWDAVNLKLDEMNAHDIPWENKQDKVFWRGPDVGGGNTPPSFTAQYQRHRFIRLASDDSSDNRTVTFAEPPNLQRYVSASVPISKLNEQIMDVAFTVATNPSAYPGGLEELLLDHRFDQSAALGHHWSYKYLPDMDGLGYSGRFMAFLASDSVPLKATVYEEFFSDWIQPWVHFIPLTATYKEIYNIHAYFSGPIEEALVAANSSQLYVPHEKRVKSDGDAQLRRIARAGKQWTKTVGRRVDMEVYVYRLCLEFARLSADDRDAMSYSS